MVTQAALARRVRKLEALVGDAGDGMLYIRRGSGMRGLAEARRFLEEKHNPRPASALTGMRAYRAEVEQVKAMIEAREAAEPAGVEEPITPLPKTHPAPDANASPSSLPTPRATPVSPTCADASTTSGKSQCLLLLGRFVSPQPQQKRAGLANLHSSMSLLQNYLQYPREARGYT